MKCRSCKGYKMKTIKLLPVLILAGLLFTACGDPLPMEDLISAKTALTKALSVKADIYAKTEYDAAAAGLCRAHDLVQNDDVKEAAEAAREAAVQAEAAYLRACPVVAKETVDIASKSLEEAAEANAEEFAPDEYSEAKELFSRAFSAYENKQYEEAFPLALKADEAAKEARTAALEKKDTLKDAIAEVKALLQLATDYHAAEYAAENMALAEENLTEAEEAYNQLAVKKGFSAVSAARINAEEACSTAMKMTAEHELSAAKARLTVLEKGNGSSENLKAVREALADAESLFSEGRYRESIEAAREAFLLSNVAAAGLTEGNPDVSAGTDVSEDKDYVLYTVVYRESLKDCLWRIADKYYGDPWKWKSIYKANKDKIQDPDLIYPGWVLKIPKLD